MMKKRIIIGSVVITLIGGLIIGGLVLTRRSASDAGNVPVLSTPTLAPTPAAIITWNDPAGFTFTYQEGIAINKHDENQNDYAQVEMTHPDHPGGLTVWARDTKYTDVTAWIKGEKAYTGANSIDTILGNQPAKKVMIAGEPNRLVTGTISDQILFSIEAELIDREFWTMVHNTISDSFVFVPLEGETVQVSQPEAAVYEGVVDEEEVLE